MPVVIRGAAWGGEVPSPPCRETHSLLCPCNNPVISPLPSSMSVTSLEPDLQAKIQETYPELRRVYFNKGL